VIHTRFEEARRTHHFAKPHDLTEVGVRMFIAGMGKTANEPIRSAVKACGVQMLLGHLHAAIIPFLLPLMGVHAGNRKAGTRLEQVFRVSRLLNL
jgi:hypothetical protein